MVTKRKTTKARVRKRVVRGKSDTRHGQAKKKKPAAKARQAAGRKPKYPTCAKLSAAVEGYFWKCNRAKPPRPYSVCQLALALDVDRLTLIRYADGKGDFIAQMAPSERALFCNTIKKAKARVEAQLEQRMLEGEANIAGCIFTLKNNFGWKDVKHEKVDLEKRKRIFVHND